MTPTQKVIVGASVLCSVLAAAVLVRDCEAGKAAQQRAATAAEIAAANAIATPAPPQPPAEPTPLERIMTAHTLKGALKVAQPLFSDETNGDSDGALLLAVWGTDRLRWADVAVAKDETSTALVQKDPEEERGKRLCASGTIVEIKVERFDGGKAYVGELMTGGGSIFRFYTVGSSGALVGQSWARVCGVVVGKYDYSNSVGGATHAVALVGMFDLPENRKPPPTP